MVPLTPNKTISLGQAGPILTAACLHSVQNDCEGISFRFMIALKVVLMRTMPPCHREINLLLAHEVLAVLEMYLHWFEGKIAKLL